VIDDLSTYLLGHRSQGGIADVLKQAEDAERFGLRRAFVSERLTRISTQRFRPSMPDVGGAL
jgi:hypothetical protein